MLAWLLHTAQLSPGQPSLPALPGKGLEPSLCLLAPSSGSCAAQAPTQSNLVNRTQLRCYLWKPVTELEIEPARNLLLHPNAS